MATDLGFSTMGFVSLPTKLRGAYFRQWIAEEQYGQMEWMARNVDRRLDPNQVLPEARSMVVVGLNYFQTEPERRGRIAKYALGKDYHKFMLSRLKQLCRQMREWGGIQKPYVDTGPVLEKPIAALAGIGWQAKNTLTISREHGQWLFLGVILTSLEFEPDPLSKDHCGSCTRCIDVCPTQAITAPYQLDARRCISYLTIEHRGAIPMEFRRAIGDHLFGCDDCLDICPWNRWARKTEELKLSPISYPDLGTMLNWDETEFQQMTAGTPIRRSGLSRWKRNICVVLGNIGTENDLEALAAASAGTDSLVAEHADWAVAEIRTRTQQSETANG